MLPSFCAFLLPGRALCGILLPCLGFCLLLPCFVFGSVVDKHLPFCAFIFSSLLLPPWLPPSPCLLPHPTCLPVPACAPCPSPPPHLVHWCALLPCLAPTPLPSPFPLAFFTHLPFCPLLLTHTHTFHTLCAWCFGRHGGIRFWFLWMVDWLVVDMMDNDYSVQVVGLDGLVGMG